MQEHCLSSVKTEGTVVVNLMLEQAAKCTITVHLPLLEQGITCTKAVSLVLLEQSVNWVIPCQFNKCFPRTPSDCFEIWHGCRTWLENNVCGFLVK